LDCILGELNSFNKRQPSKFTEVGTEISTFDEINSTSLMAYRSVSPQTYIFLTMDQWKSYVCKMKLGVGTVNV
jgi:hypothetical protein